ncbi:putative zinc-binding protein [Massilia scottii]|uniref:putative zinc-binding protein n=1 Tax=Massilia scottii TaxID=3057166 RepID=UPI0027968FD9|nr:putative zinc-binding protein [Massilia sp. CCM 9029]MDQ1829378.1 putative zinc-binding protein [Massilia sp. CCM 9029]
MDADRAALPLVYSCSGCSSAAQMANHLALALDRSGAAEMSCIAGVGGGVAPLVKLARSGRPVLAIDGCPLACARQCLAQQGVVPDQHVMLNEFGVRKRMHADFDRDHAAQLAAQLRSDVGQLRKERVVSASCSPGVET